MSHAQNENLVTNGSFEAAGAASDLPDGCDTWVPFEAVAPSFTWDTGTARSGQRSLKIEQPGKPGCYGRWEVTIPELPPATHYRVSVYAKTAGVEIPARSVAVELSWFGPGKEGDLFHGKCGWQHVGRRASPEGGWQRFERVVWRPAGAESLRVDLYLRWTEKGTVWFDDLHVVPVTAPQPRPVSIAVSGTRCGDTDPIAAARYWAEQITLAVKEGADLIVLPEFSAGAAYDTPEQLPACSTPIPGPVTDLIAAAARNAGALVVYNLLENSSGVLYNTSVLFGRSGAVVGTYRKVHLAIYVVWAGITPGAHFPVFDTDIGRAGMLVCWDNTFPESARTLAAHGAEIVITNNGTTSASRAADSGVVIAQANTGGKAGCIIAADGTVLALVENDCPFVYATADLAAICHWRGKPQFDDARSRMWNERRPEAYGPLTAASPAGHDASPRSPAM